MNKIKFIPENEKMEYEIKSVFNANYQLAEMIISRTYLLPFEFPANLQLRNFHLEKLTFNEATGESSFTTILTLDNYYKQTGYFETYTFVTPLETGYYRIRAGSSDIYISYNLFECKNVDEFPNGFYIVDELGNLLVDENLDNIIEPF